MLIAQLVSQSVEHWINWSVVMTFPRHLPSSTPSPNLVSSRPRSLFVKINIFWDVMPFVAWYLFTKIIFFLTALETSNLTSYFSFSIKILLLLMQICVDLLVELHVHSFICVIFHSEIWKHILFRITGNHHRWNELQQQNQHNSDYYPRVAEAHATELSRSKE
jgi:hypothetical protein